MFRAWHLAELIPLLDGQLLGADVQVRRVHTDTRSLRDGDLFVALTGDTFDGHDYLPQAEAVGAAAALVDAWQDSSELPQWRWVIPGLHWACWDGTTVRSSRAP